LELSANGAPASRGKGRAIPLNARGVVADNRDSPSHSRPRKQEGLVPRHIEKLLVPVRVVLGGESIVGSVSVAERAELRHGPETLLELLNTPKRVLPLLREQDQAIVLINRLGIEYVEPDSSVETTLVRPDNYLVTREERVEVRFLDGNSVEGRVEMELPEHINRASDFLNGPEDFFPLVTRNLTILVNKSRVSGTRVFESSPKPISIESFLRAQ
jgi:hypothetical protein